MSNSNDDRRPGQQGQGEKNSTEQQQGGGQGKPGGGQQGGQSNPGGQQGGKDPRGGQSRQGSMDDDKEQDTGRGTQQPNKSSNPGSKGGRSE